MLEKVRDMILGHDLLVLATQAGCDEPPHLSLMAYVAMDDAKGVFLATSRLTRKFRLIQADPRVSALIDTREIHNGSGRSSARSLSLTGWAQAMPQGPERDEALGRLGQRLAHLREFLEREDTEIVQVRFITALLLEGLENKHFEEIE